MFSFCFNLKKDFTFNKLLETFRVNSRSRKLQPIQIQTHLGFLKFRCQSIRWTVWSEWFVEQLFVFEDFTSAVEILKKKKKKKSREKFDWLTLQGETDYSQTIHVLQTFKRRKISEKRHVIDVEIRNVLNFSFIQAGRSSRKYTPKF